MVEVEYLHEKIVNAVECLASGAGPFEERLHNAYISALMRLDSCDATVELADDLNWVLQMCQQHAAPDTRRMSPIAEQDRGMIAEKLVSLLVKASRMTRDD